MLLGRFVTIAGMWRREAPESGLEATGVPLPFDERAEGRDAVADEEVGPAQDGEVKMRVVLGQLRDNSQRGPLQRILAVKFNLLTAHFTKWSQ